MTDHPGQHFYEQGDAAYNAGDLVTALRWWLQGIDVDNEECLTAALEVSRSDEQNHAWDHLLHATKQARETALVPSLLPLVIDGSPSESAPDFVTDPLATWSQFTLSPIDDLATVATLVNGEFVPIDRASDPEWQRILEYLEYRDIIIDIVGCNYVGGNWQSELEWSVPIFFGIDPVGTQSRRLRIFTPLLIGLPAPDMAPNIGQDSPLAQAGFTLPLRPIQALFVRGCMKLADPVLGFMSFMPTMRFADVPEPFQPMPQFSAGNTGWIIGPDAIYPLRYPLPQVSIGYAIDLQLSGPHLDSAISGAVDGLVAAVAKVNEACEGHSGIFCEYITSITNLVARKQWADLFADFVYPATFAEATILAESGDLAAMVNLGAMLAATPGFEPDAQQWFDTAIARGYAPALAAKTWSLLSVERYDHAIEEWARHRVHCEDATNGSAEPDKTRLSDTLRSAQANAAIAEFLRGGNVDDCLRTWEELVREGHLASRIYLQVAPLMANTMPNSGDFVDAGRRIAHIYADTDWLGPTYLTLSEGLANGAGKFQEWCRRALEVCVATGLPLRLADLVSANDARILARALIDSGEETLGAPLQEAATRFGLPYAGADHSWRMLEQGHFHEAIALYEEAAPAVETRVATMCGEIPDEADVWTREWANYQSNIALCHIASGRPDAWALETWRAGAATGNVESIFYPAVIALRSGNRAAAQEIVDEMGGEKIAEMTVIALEGSRSSATFWREWSQDGLRLLQSRDSLESTPAPLGGGLSAHKTSSGLGRSGFSDTSLGSSRESSLGSPPTDAPASTADGFRFCPQCGEARVPGGRFCAGCGFAYP